MPVHFCQISCQCSGKHQRDIGDGRTVTKLLCTVTSHKITGYQSGRKRNNQSRPHPQHGADGYQLPHFIRKQIKNTTRPEKSQPICNNKRLFTFSVNLPDNKIKGMIRSDGNEDNIWISRSVAEGNILFKSPKMGDTASPGNALSARWKIYLLT